MIVILTVSLLPANPPDGRTSASRANLCLCDAAPQNFDAAAFASGIRVRRPFRRGPRHHPDREPPRRSSGGRTATGAGPAATNRQRIAYRHHRRARRRQIDHDRRARHIPHPAGTQDRGARSRPVLGPHRRIDSRRQDPHGAAVLRSSRVHPPLAGRRHARRRGGKDARDHADLRGGGLRRRAGGNHRHRPVGDRGRPI